jgi:hypothetical protein
MLDAGFFVADDATGGRATQGKIADLRLLAGALQECRARMRLGDGRAPVGSDRRLRRSPSPSGVRALPLRAARPSAPDFLKPCGKMTLCKS